MRLGARSDLATGGGVAYVMLCYVITLNVAEESEGGRERVRR